MKTVFNSNTQLAQTFAIQSQSHGRTKSMFFEYGTAYSYGYHYIGAKFVTANNGEKVCFVNSRYYSPTTAKHCGQLWNAIPDGIKVFRVPLPRVFDLDQLPTIIKVMTEQAEGYLFKQLTARKNTVNFYIANNLISDIKEISELFGLNVPRNWDFKNYEQARQKIYTIQNAA
jgi:hypothetical protein